MLFYAIVWKLHLYVLFNPNQINTVVLGRSWATSRKEWRTWIYESCNVYITTSNFWHWQPLSKSPYRLSDYLTQYQREAQDILSSYYLCHESCSNCHAAGQFPGIWDNREGGMAPVAHMISSHRLAPGTVHRTFHSLLTPSLTGFSVNSFVGGSLLPLLCHGPRLVEEKTSWFMESTCPSLRKNLLFIQFILVQLRELSTALALSVPLGSLPCVSFKFRKAASATFRNGWTRSWFSVSNYNVEILAFARKFDWCSGLNILLDESDHIRLRNTQFLIIRHTERTYRISLGIVRFRNANYPSFKSSWERIPEPRRSRHNNNTLTLSTSDDVGEITEDSLRRSQSFQKKLGPQTLRGIVKALHR